MAALSVRVLLIEDRNRYHRVLVAGVTPNLGRKDAAVRQLKEQEPWVSRLAGHDLRVVENAAGEAYPADWEIVEIHE